MSEENRTWCIYGYRESATGRFWYVGQTRVPVVRDRQHRRRWKSQVTFAKAVLQVRPNDFEFVILMANIPTRDDANYWENYHIVVQKTWHGFGDHGYNMHWALNGPPSDAGREANRIAHQKPEYRAKLRARIKTPETRRLSSIATKARLADPRNHPRYGKHWDEAHRRAIGNRHRGKTISQSHRTAINRYWDDRADFLDNLEVRLRELGLAHLIVKRRSRAS